MPDEEDCKKGEVYSERRGKCVKAKKILVKQSYDIVTEESAKEGDVAESGWENEEGSEYETAEEVAEKLLSEGVIQGGNGTFQNEASQDMYSGEWRTDYYHVSGIDKEDEEVIEEMLKERGVSVY